MTVQELIKELGEHPGNWEVRVEHECEGADVAPIVEIDRLIVSRDVLIITTKN